MSLGDIRLYRYFNREFRTLLSFKNELKPRHILLMPAIVLCTFSGNCGYDDHHTKDAQTISPKISKEFETPKLAQNIQLEQKPPLPTRSFNF